MKFLLLSILLLFLLKVTWYMHKLDSRIVWLIYRVFNVFYSETIDCYCSFMGVTCLHDVIELKKHRSVWFRSFQSDTEPTCSLTLRNTSFLEYSVLSSIQNILRIWYFSRLTDKLARCFLLYLLLFLVSKESYYRVLHPVVCTKWFFCGFVSLLLTGSSTTVAFAGS